jgi:hypothetical protein
MQGRYLAVGTSVLFGGYCQEPNQQELFQRMRHWQPLARTSTFLIFDVNPESETRQPLIAERNDR